jgi:2-dehydropantoate 2-reductase
MRVAIIGMGAIGHVIERALAGRVEIVPIDRTKTPLRPGEKPVDAAVVCVKTPGTPWAAELAQRIVAPDGVLLTIQNGLGNYETLVAAVGEPRVAVGVIYVGARMEQGKLWATGPGRVELGLPSRAGPRRALETLAARLADGGMTVSVVKDAWHSVWRKVAVNAAMNPTTALLGYTNAELLADVGATRVADAIAAEVARVATATGVGLSEEEARGAWHEIATVTGANRSSMLQDVQAHRPTEIDAICGAVYREGERRGIAAPLNQAMTVLVEGINPARPQ